MSLSAGTRLGPYEILSVLGAGGMGEVYRARDTRLGRAVAIKVAQEKFSERFRREARTIAALNHPNICVLYDVGPDYLVMEYVEGTPVTPVDSPRKLLDIALQIADGMATAHAAGVVHRDLKPDNILVTREGRVKILDFGLAKNTRDRHAAGQSESDSTLTITLTELGTIVGTIAYMSPEQAQGLPLDARSDQFSFGLILYEMASGKRAFKRASVAETMAAIIREDAEPLPDPVPAPIRRVIDQCLAKDPAERYDSTRDLHSELRHVREQLTDIAIAVEPQPAPPPKEGAANNLPSASEFKIAGAMRKWLVGMVALAVVVVLGLVLLPQIRRPSVQKPIDSVAVLPFPTAAELGDDLAIAKATDFVGVVVTEGVINHLSTLPGLQTTARSVTAGLKGRYEDPRKIGEQLGVRGVITGRVIVRGSAFNIQVELVDVLSGAQVFGKPYDGKLPDDLLTVDQQISKDIAEKLHIAVPGEVSQQMTKSSTNILFSAVIYGSVYDSTQRPMPGVDVKLENTVKGLAHTTVTDREGSYKFAQVPPAEGYRIVASKGDWLDIRDGINALGGEEKAIWPPLQLRAQ